MTACIEWTGRCNDGGYGTWGRKLAHRLAWVEANGPIPAGMCVLHACDNPPCINVDHLWLGTQADNAADRESKGRGNSLRRALVCPRKHVIDGVKGDGSRYCLTCNRERSRRYRALV